MNKRRKSNSFKWVLVSLMMAVTLGGIISGIGKAFSFVERAQAKEPIPEHKPTTSAASRTSSSVRITEKEPVQEEVEDMSRTPSESTAIPKDAWNLVLVNRDHPMQEGYVPKLSKADENGAQFDSRAVAALQEMLKAARAENLKPLICSSYRTQEKQSTLFEKQVTRRVSAGMARETAVLESSTVVAYPGTSEHQLGLAVDIVALENQVLDENQLKTPEQQWLIKNCAQYGFILRYPQGKSDITGVIFEPWHYRYVGIPAAQEMTEGGLTLEEYLQ